MATSLQTSLLPDAVQGSESHVVAWFSRDGHATRLGRVLELAVTPASGNEVPAIFVKQAKHLGNLHCERISGLPECYKPAPGLAV
jgi:hypothetical protein